MQCWKIFILCCAFVSSAKCGRISISVAVDFDNKRINKWGIPALEYPTSPPKTNRDEIWTTTTSTTEQSTLSSRRESLPRIFTFPGASERREYNVIGDNSLRPQSYVTTTPEPQIYSTPSPSFLTAIAPTSHAAFSDNLFQILAPENAAQNLIYSPISLQSLLALLYVGAKDNTADQLKIGLALPDSVNDVLNEFGATLSESQRPSSDFTLNFAHNIFFQPDLILRSNIKDNAAKYFRSEVTKLSFQSSPVAAETINTWVADKTQSHIKEIIQPDSIDAQTQAIIVNAIYMKAKWSKEFSTSDTVKQEFFLNSIDNSKFVDMMYIEDEFKYKEFPEFDARIVNLPFMDSDLSMMIILPNKINGLASVERLLKGHDFNQLLQNMNGSPLTLKMPKFRIETELNMQEPLGKLGITDIFSDNANLSNMFVNRYSKVSKIQHKAYIDVNEGGIEAAAATFSQIVPLSLQPNMVYFTADHPFMFVIRSPRAVYFIGHVIDNFQK